VFVLLGGIFGEGLSHSLPHKLMRLWTLWRGRSWVASVSHVYGRA
jgi:hypothetical protein